MLAMALIVITPLLRLQLHREFREHNIADGVDGGFEVGAAVPDLYKIAVEAAGEGEAAYVVALYERSSVYRLCLQDTGAGYAKVGESEGIDGPKGRG